MSKEVKTYDAPKSVTFDVGRWNVCITMEMQDGTTEKFVASADSYYTQNDGIWFGTQADYEDTF